MSRKRKALPEDRPLTPDTGSALAEDLYPMVTVPFFGRPRVMRLRRLSQNQVNAAIGDTPLNWGEVEPGAGDTASVVADAVTMLDLMDKAARVVMVDPSYDEFVAEIDRIRPDGARASAIAEIDEIRKKLEQYSDPSDPEVVSLQAKADEVRSMECYPLPEDAYGFLFSFAVRADAFDMRTYTTERMLQAAVLGERYGERPCDIAGIEEERGFLREDFDTQATVELERHRADARAVSGSSGMIRRG